MISPNNDRRKVKVSIIKLSIVTVLMVVGILLSVFSFHIPFINNGLYKFTSFSESIKLGIDLKGGIYAVYTVADEDTSNLDERLDGTRTRLENLLVGKGYTEAVVVREGADRIRVEVPDVDDPQAVFTIIGKPAKLKFVLESTSEVVIEGDKHLVSATPIDNYQGKPAVEVVFNSAGASRFHTATSENINGTMNIVISVEGEEDSVMPITINSAISDGKAIISGGMATYAEAKELADSLMSGSFSVQLKLLESDTVEATLGEQALYWGVIAGAISMVIIFVFLCLVYRGLGAIASYALILYLVLMLFLLAVIPLVQLTLPGIAGIILSLGMAIDANIVIFERIKDDYRGGKSLNASIHSGFRRALSAIVDGNITSIIAGVVLYIFGTGAIKGFAITLLIGIVLSMFTAIIVTRSLIKWTTQITGDKPSWYNLRVDAPATEVTSEA